MLSRLKEHDVVAIDEGHLFPDVVKFCSMAASLNKMVIVVARESTSERKAFGNIIALVPLAESISKLSAVCPYCTNDAAFTRRVVFGK